MLARAAFASLLGLFAAAASACAASPGIESAPDSARTSPSAGLLMVCNQNDATISIIDLDARREVHRVDLQALGFSANSRPHHIAVEPDGSYWYVSLIGEGRVVKLDREHRVVGAAPFETPGMLALDPSSGHLYVGRSMTAVNPPNRIGRIRRSDMTIEELDVFFPRPHAMALNAESGVAYTASLGVNQIAAVDPETDRAVLTDVEGPPHALMQFALSPDGTTLVISGEVSHTVHFFDLSDDPLRPHHAGSVSVPAQPFDPIFSADGRTVWLGNKRANVITGIDAESLRVVHRLEDPRIREPHGAALSLDGRWIVISNTNVREDHAMHGQGARAAVSGGRGSVALIDAATGILADVIEVGNNATGIAVSP